MDLHKTPNTGKMESLLRQLIRGNALFFMFILGIGGSFQNGFHITGISSPSPYIQRFINSSWYKRYEEPVPPQTSTLIWSATMSLYAVGGLFGAASVKCAVGKLGRKRGMIGYNFINIAAAVVMLTSKGANSFEMVILGRFLYGFAAGLGGTTHWLYLGESSPKNTRGIMTQSYVTFFSIGKLSGQLLGLSEILGREELWHILLSVPTCFSVAQLLILPFFPEAPRYLLIEKGDAEACKKALQCLWGQGEYKLEMEEMVAEQAAIKGARPKSPLELVRDRSVRWQLITMNLVIYCIQFSGTTMISNFSFDIFLNAGIPREKIRYVTLSIGLSEVLTALFSGLLIEHIGRRPLLWGGFGIMSVILVFITVTLNLKDSNYWVPYITAGLIILLTIIGVGGPEGTASSLCNEIYLQPYRPAAGVIMAFQRWLNLAVLSQIFPFIIEAFKSYCFVQFACASLLGSLYSFFLLPETKGKTVLQISQEFKAITVCGKSFSVEERQKVMRQF